MISKILKSFRYAGNGLKATWREEHNFRVEILMAIFVILLLIYFQFTIVESALCIVAITIVLSAEIVNTAIEDLSDMVEANPNPLIGKIKDTMAGFVLVSSLGALTLGLMIFINHFQ